MTDHTTDIPLKRCSKCDEEKPATAEYFQPRTDSKDGLRGSCRICEHTRRADRYAANREQSIADARRWAIDNAERVAENQRRWSRANRKQINEKNRQWRKDHPEQAAAYSKRWQDKNPEKVRERHRRWYYRNLEKCRDYCRCYYERNREQRREYHLRYNKAHKQERAETYKRWARKNPTKVRAIVHRRQARLRAATGTLTSKDIQRQYEAQKGRCWWCNCDLDDGFHVDHLIPLARGGSNAPENIVISCPHCNQSKGAKLPHEWCGRLF